MLLIPQRYNFSSKSQPKLFVALQKNRCCWYHKGTIFQANHNANSKIRISFTVVVDTTKVQFFKQITTSYSLLLWFFELLLIPQRYNFSSKSQLKLLKFIINVVVVDTTKVQFFKQITTMFIISFFLKLLLLIPQRYNFSSKSQQNKELNELLNVVVDTTKVQFFKQITTDLGYQPVLSSLLLIPQRYNFSSKSQLASRSQAIKDCCCWYHKGTIFQANHNVIT